MPPKTTLRRTTDLQMPKKTDGTVDNRYTTPQFVNKNGSRDMRTTPTNLRK
jgi:hypothetical protein